MAVAVLVVAVSLAREGSRRREPMAGPPVAVPTLPPTLVLAEVVLAVRLGPPRLWARLVVLAAVAA